MAGKKTPRWRGITLAQEIQHEGMSIAMASDNVRDQVISTSKRLFPMSHEVFQELYFNCVSEH